MALVQVTSYMSQLKKDTHIYILMPQCSSLWQRKICLCIEISVQRHFFFFKKILYHVCDVFTRVNLYTVNHWFITGHFAHFQISKHKSNRRKIFMFLNNLGTFRHNWVKINESSANDKLTDTLIIRWRELCLAD